MLLCADMGSMDVLLGVGVGMCGAAGRVRINGSGRFLGYSESAYERLANVECRWWIQGWGILISKHALGC